MRSEWEPGVVFDCNLFLQAAVRRSGPAFALIERLEEGLYTLYVSREVLKEIGEVLSRPKLRQKFSLLTPECVRQFLDRLLEAMVMVENVPEHFEYKRDPKDQPYVNLALVAKADYLVSWDQDLLDLMGNQPEGVMLRQNFPFLKIINPVDFLRMLSET